MERAAMVWFLGLASAVCGAVAAQETAEVRIRTTHVAGNVYLLEGRGGNVGVSVGEDGLLIVDDQFAPLADKIRAALRELGAGKLAFVLNTHWHGDHTGGNAVFGREAPIVAHRNVRRRLSGELQPTDRTAEPQPPHALPVITFDDGLSIHFNGEEIRAVHFAHGHTDGDTVVFFTGSNVVHLGDLFFAGRFPFIDLGTGGDLEGLIDNVAKIIVQLPEDARLIPGHGPVSRRDDLEAYHRMLVDTSEVVRSAMRQGKSLEEIQRIGLPEVFAAWGGGFISEARWIETVYRSLRGEGGAE